METKCRKRLNAFVTDETYEYVSNTADEIGISISGFINLCINQYKQQSIALDSMSKFGEFLERLESLESSLKK